MPPHVVPWINAFPSQAFSFRGLLPFKAARVSWMGSLFQRPPAMRNVDGRGSTLAGRITATFQRGLIPNRESRR